MKLIKSIGNFAAKFAAKPESIQAPHERRAILAPAVAILALGLLLAAGFMVVATVELNRSAEETSRRLAKATFVREMQRIAELTLDYAFWDDAVKNLTVKPDVAWADQNIGTYLHETFGITLSAVLDLQGKTILSFRESKLAEQDTQHLLSAPLVKFMLARNSAIAGKKPGVQSILQRADDGVYIVGFAPFTAEYENAADAVLRSRPLLVIARKLDGSILDDLGRAVTLTDFRILPAQPGDSASIPLQGPTGATVGYAAWRQDYPGDILWWRMIPGAVGILIAMAILIYLLMRKADEIIHARQVVARELFQERTLSEIRRRFVSMISHEVRTPLANIQAANDLLRLYSGQMQELERLDELASIQNSIKTINAIIEDVISLDKIDAWVTDPEPVDLVEVCREQWREIRSAARTNHSLCLQNGESPVLARADKKLTRSVIRNLLGNAMKYSPADSTVTINFIDGEDTVYVVVQDQGCGIAKADREYIFDPFFRGANVAHIQGIGLGLAIVKSAVNQMGGSVRLLPDTMAGTSIELGLPKAG
ncbi:MAG: ATP-binding protein [Alphaproteobacteria bacterium]